MKMLLCFCAVLTLLPLFHAKATLLLVNNPSFEDDVVGNGTFISGNTAPLSWSVHDPTNVLVRNYSDVGVLNPTGTTLYVSGAPQGSKVALIFLWPQNSGDFNVPVGIQQTLSSTLQANTQYTLSVQVGNIASDGNPSYSLTGFPGYRVQLFAGSNLLAEDNSSLSPAEGVFALSSFQFTTGASPSDLGQALTIRLINKNAPNSGIEVNFDDVKLDAVAVPEPSTFVLLSVGLVAIWRRVRFQKLIKA